MMGGYDHSMMPIQRFIDNDEPMQVHELFVAELDPDLQKYAQTYAVTKERLYQVQMMRNAKASAYSLDDIQYKVRCIWERG